MTYKRRMEAPLSVGLFSSVAVHRDSGIVFTGHEDSKIGTVTIFLLSLTLNPLF